MKELTDGTKVPARIYYYLLDWNEVDEYNTIHLLYNKMKLSDLNSSQFNNLFYVATKNDFEKLK